MSRTVGVAAAAFALLLCAVAAQLGHATTADAAVYGFCENVQLGQNGYCAGSTTGLYQDYGWGDQHSVCIDIRPWPNVRRCSSGPGAGVYSGEIPPNNAGLPWIENNAAGSNYVHGVYFTP
jgi:hypothetical protein